MALGNTTEEEFWALTPRQYMVHMSAARKRLEREQEDRIELAWHTAHLTRVAKLRPLKKYLEKRGKTKPAAPDEVLGRLRAMTATMPTRSWEDWLR